jgi:hypothetical protein
MNGVRIDMHFEPSDIQGRDEHEFIVEVSRNALEDFKSWLAQMCPDCNVHTTIPYPGTPYTIMGITMGNDNEAMRFKLAYHE